MSYNRLKVVAIQSNIGDVIGRLKFIQSEMPKIMERAIHPTRWFLLLRQVATSTLYGLAEDGEQPLVGKFIDTMTSSMVGGKASYHMHRPGGSELLTVRQASDIADKYGRRSKFGPDMLEQATVEQAREMLQQWAQDPEGKRKNAEDVLLMSKAGKYADELTERLWWIFGLHPNEFGKGGISPGMQGAMDRILPHISIFFEAQNGELNGPMVDTWLRRVLAAWRSYMEEELPKVIRKELSEALKKR